MTTQTFRKTRTACSIARDPGALESGADGAGRHRLLPRDPRCGECPLARQIVHSAAEGTQHEFPAKRAKPAPERLTRTCW